MTSALWLSQAGTSLLNKGMRRCGVVGGLHPSPGGRRGLCGLSLQPRVTRDVLSDRHLHLGRDVWGRVADLHGRLQEAQGVGVLQLVCHLASRAGVLEGSWGCVSRRGAGGLLVPPGRPAQLPKEKEKNCHQGHTTHNHHHCEEADRGACPRREPGRDTQRPGKPGRGLEEGAHTGTKTEEEKRVVVRTLPRRRSDGWRADTPQATRLHRALTLQPPPPPPTARGAPYHWLACPRKGKVTSVTASANAHICGAFTFACYLNFY